MNNQTEYRCSQCGHVGAPASSPGAQSLVVLGLWALSGTVWALGSILAMPILFYVGGVLFLPALLYTLRYFFRRERACRHCGSPELEPETRT